MDCKDKHVLIVEDQRPFLLLLRGLINSMGATEVDTKSSAEQAIALCKKRKFDIVIVDLHLGADRKNGYEFIEELRIRKLVKPSTIFLLISADSARPVVLGSLERRPDDYLIKPFSQSQLKTRLSRAWNKRQFLLPVHTAMVEQDWQQAIEHCKSKMTEPSPFQRFCLQLLVELYWKSGVPENALALLLKLSKEKSALWSQIALAKTYLQMNEYQKAIDTAQLILQSNRFYAEAYDILAESQNKLEKGEEAVSAIKHAIKLSPYSLQRHFTACAIARENEDFELAQESSLSIWQLSKRTIHQDVAHWCSYIRSILDAAEHAEEKKAKNRCQQEALLVLQRGKSDDVLQRLKGEFDLDIYEQVVQARMCTLDGKMMDAKRNLAQSQVTLENKYEEYPIAYAPDSLKVMYDLGEYDDALALVKIMQEQGVELDPNTQHLMASETARSEEKQKLYQQFNRQGIQLYQEGKFEQAKDAFYLAQQYAPVNTGIALNLLQCILKILAKFDNPDAALVSECRRVYKLIEDVPLRKQHQEKFDELKDDLFTYIN
ncbi:response regulator [Alteromonas ponticola]|uniref:Response regulator n=1 Tax=Alteromonas aquimaris TaxID=2998417 RepID=A0ABT3P6W4_9ALTE|nr:tetratricopeptide repeat-containing response regulator [Alteromonas aquimaris]MCW8108502.1 response regulator [Alteromonas aquimaris]